MGHKILTLNLGTTSTRISLYENKSLIAEKSLYHSDEELSSNTESEHVQIRKAMVEEWLVGVGETLSELSAIAVRTGGLPKVVPGGTLTVDDNLRKALYTKYLPDKPLYHGNQIIMPLADALAEAHNIPIFAVEPANQNNMIPEARVSGLPEIERTTTFHALNEKNVAHLQAEKIGKAYADCNFITAHLGGGISVSCHQKGRITDTNNCSANEGAFSATRVGTLPVMQVVKLCFSGKYTEEEIGKLLSSKGGIVAYLGVSDLRDVEKMADTGDEMATLIFNTVAYRTAKEIGALCAVVEGQIDAIILTGGMTHSKKMAEKITQYVERFAPVAVYPGEKESEALARSVYRVLIGEETSQTY